jgi:hypothetical protein
LTIRHAEAGGGLENGLSGVNPDFTKPGISGMRGASRVHTFVSQDLQKLTPMSTIHLKINMVKGAILILLFLVLELQSMIC